MRGRGGKIQRQKRNTIEEEGSSSQVNGQNGAYWKKFNIWYQKLRYWRHNSVPHCIDFMHVEKDVVVSLVRTLLHVPRKTKDGVNARLDLAELGVKPKLFAMQEEDKTTLPPAGYTLTNAKKDTFCETLHNIRVIKGHVQNKNKPEGCIAKETIAEETIEFFSEYHKSMETIGIPPDKHETDENKEGKPLSAGNSSEVSAELFQKAHLRHKQVLKTENQGKRIAFLENKHSKYFAKWLRKEVERELAISKESVSETVRWISYGPRTTVVKYDAYNINGYTFRTKCHDGKVYQNSEVSVQAIDLHISKEVATTRQAFYKGAGGVKRDDLWYTLVDLNNLGHKVDPFILASQARQVIYVKDQIDKKLSIVFKTSPKNYKDTYDEVDEEFSTVIYQRNDNILPILHIVFAACICTLHLYIAFAACICRQAFADYICTLHLQLAFAHCNCTLPFKAYIVLNKETMRIEKSLNVTFDESLPEPKSSSSVEDDRIIEPIVQNLVRSLSLEANASEPTCPKSLKEARGYPIEQVIGELDKSTLRSKTKQA
ncbi:hypothetical protein Tco_1123709 [Tanacetum coccineum]|uniref:Uncharacterized protein n=1 Tax=Tanacetum coccineum TaxID=301880 RepID=A0ABQ5J4E6_9ASTR